MQSAPVSWFGRWRLAGACAAYALLMLYSSTIIGPDGINFVYKDPVAVFRIFLATPYVITGSDQRADWMGNLLMLVPFGFLLTGLLWPKRPTLKLPAAFMAILIAVATILTIKYLQLFFPPRTVTLNYITAQTVGAVIGCVGGFAADAVGFRVGRDGSANPGRPPGERDHESARRQQVSGGAGDFDRRGRGCVCTGRHVADIRQDRC